MRQSLPGLVERGKGKRKYPGGTGAAVTRDAARSQVRTLQVEVRCGLGLEKGAVLDPGGGCCVMSHRGHYGISVFLSPS